MHSWNFDFSTKKTKSKFRFLNEISISQRNFDFNEISISRRNFDFSTKFQGDTWIGHNYVSHGKRQKSCTLIVILIILTYLTSPIFNSSSKSTGFFFLQTRKYILLFFFVIFIQFDKFPFLLQNFKLELRRRFATLVWSKRSWKQNGNWSSSWVRRRTPSWGRRWKTWKRR